MPDATSADAVGLVQRGPRSAGGVTAQARFEKRLSERDDTGRTRAGPGWNTGDDGRFLEAAVVQALPAIGPRDDAANAGRHQCGCGRPGSAWSAKRRRRDGATTVNTISHRLLIAEFPRTRGDRGCPLMLTRL